VSRGATLPSSGIGSEEESVRVFWNILYMALPLCFVPSYSNVLERILLDGDFHDFCGPQTSINITEFKTWVAYEAFHCHFSNNSLL